MNEPLKENEEPCTIADVTHRFFTPTMAKETADNAQKEFAAKEYETEQVLDKIKEAAELGEYSLETYYDENIAKKLRLLGYNVSDGFEGCFHQHYMTIDWSNGA